MPPQREHLPYLTPLRGIAALVVVLFHAFSYTGHLAIFTEAYTDLVRRGYLWVDFFFLLSGYVLTHVYAGWFEGRSFPWGRYWRFMRARAARIYPVHLLTLAGMVAIIWWQARADSSLLAQAHFTREAILTNLLLIHSLGIHEVQTWNYPSWSISTEWYVYVIFPLIVTATGKRWLRWLSMLTCVTMLLRLGLVHGSLHVTYDLGFLRCLAEFTIGCCLYRWFGGRIWRRSWGAWAALVALVTMLSMPRAYVHDLLVVPVMAVLMVSLAGYRGRAFRWLQVAPLQWLGRASYALYMSHALVLTALMPLLGQWLSDYRWTVQGGLAMVACLLPACLLVAGLLHHCFEVPARRSLRGGQPQRAVNPDPTCETVDLAR